MPIQQGYAPPAMKPFSFPNYAAASAPPVSASTEPGSVRFTPVGSYGQPQPFPNQSSALSRTTAAPGLVGDNHNKTSASVQAILNRLLAPSGGMVRPY